MLVSSSKDACFVCGNVFLVVECKETNGHFSFALFIIDTITSDYCVAYYLIFLRLTILINYSISKFINVYYVFPNVTNCFNRFNTIVYN